MALCDEDKTEINDIVKNALESLKKDDTIVVKDEIIGPIETAIIKPINIPVPKPPKANEELIEEQIEEEEKVKEGMTLNKFLKKIWG